MMTIFRYILKVGSVYVTDIESTTFYKHKGKFRILPEEVSLGKRPKVFMTLDYDEMKDVSHLEEFLGGDVEVIRLKEDTK